MSLPTFCLLCLDVLKVEIDSHEQLLKGFIIYVYSAALIKTSMILVYKQYLIDYKKLLLQNFLYNYED